MKFVNFVFAIVTLVAAFLMQGCGAASSTGGTTVSIPSTASLVAASLPKGLVAGNTAVVSAGSLHKLHVRDLEEDARALASPDGHLTHSNSSLASGYLTNMFQEKFSNVQGYVMYLASNLDSAMSTFTSAQISAHTCLSSTAQSATIGMSAIDSMLSLKLPYLQCVQSNSTVGGGGTIFGQSGSNTSIFNVIGTDFTGAAIPAGSNINTSLGTPGGGFWNYGNITNAGSTSAASPQMLDAVAISYSPLNIPNSSSNYTTTTTNPYPNLAVTRFKASPSANTFELYYAATSGDITSAQSGSHVFMGAGFRAISDGNHIYSDGTLCNDPQLVSGGCSTSTNWVAFTACLNAADVSVDSTASDCTALSTSFTIASSATLNYQELTTLNSSNVGNMTNPPTVIPQKAAAEAAVQAAAPVSSVTPAPASW
jgi:hypothetical protein